jgi:hypothetical protein
MNESKPNTTSLDTIITLIKVTLEDKKVAEGHLQAIDTRLKALYDQARAALEGTGLSLVLMDTFADSTVQNITITRCEELQDGDTVKVKVAEWWGGSGKWQACRVSGADIDEDGFSVYETLSDDSSYVDAGTDEWEFVSRPSGSK